MFKESPIYDRLITERGDVPAQVRSEAERVNRELELVMGPLQSPGTPRAATTVSSPRGTAGSAPPFCPAPGRTDPGTATEGGPVPSRSPVLTGPQHAVVGVLSTSTVSSGTGRASHSATVRAIGWPVSTSTNPNCPD